MSGITPLIDTLLHQVLGKRVDFLRGLPLNPPINAPTASEAARPVTDDAQLDNAPTPDRATYLLSNKAGLATVNAQAAMNHGAAVMSARTRFSEAAQLISDALLSEEVQIPTVSIKKPILTPEVGQPVSSQQVADKLKQSISNSGLFYESHVARWYKGEIPLKTLLAEAQSRASLISAQATAEDTPANSTVVVTKVNTDAAVEAPEKLLSLNNKQMLAKEESASVLFDKGASNSRENLNPTTLLRNQLELMNTPVLRWEGQVWPDFSVALQLKLLPSGEEEEAKKHNKKEQNTSSFKEWEFQCTVRSSNKSKLDIHARSDGMNLWLTLGSCSKAVLALLERDRVKLTQRLKEHGFITVELRGQWVPRAEGSG